MEKDGVVTAALVPAHLLPLYRGWGGSPAGFRRWEKHEKKDTKNAKTKPLTC
jgi:hypothetical protein